MGKKRKTLADQYLFTIGQLIAGNTAVYEKVAKKIKENEPEIRNYHRSHGNLNGAKFSGIGPKTMPILEALLSENGDALNEAIAKAFTTCNFKDF